MTEEIQHLFEQFLVQERLPASFLPKLTDHYLPLADSAGTWRSQQGGPLILGINGAQGTGKSTLAAALSMVLEQIHGLRTTVMSIDDLYLTKADRQKISSEIHPLLLTRGVPGTHDVHLGCELLDSLEAGNPCSIPRFDKSRDDRAPEDQWTRVDHPVDVILFEGWCIGARPEPASALSVAVNELESMDDPTGAWREFVNQSLSGPYAALFGRIHRLVMLCPPSFECIRDWRGEQEEKLREQCIASGKPLPDGVMDDAALTRFIMHYERLTRWMLDEIPPRADHVFQMNQDREIVETHT